VSCLVSGGLILVTGGVGLILVTGGGGLRVLSLNVLNVGVERSGVRGIGGWTLSGCSRSSVFGCPIVRSLQLLF